MVRPVNSGIMRSLIRTLITEGMGYCCPWAFFQFFRRSGEIAARLGVTVRTVQLAKKKVREKEWICERCPKCMRPQVEIVRVLGRDSIRQRSEGGG